MEDWIGFSVGIIGIILAVISRSAQGKYVKVARVIITAINSLDQVIGDQNKKKVKRAVCFQSLAVGNEKFVHEAVKKLEKE